MPSLDGDIYVISFPKCGRTWLRFLMARAISLDRGLPMELIPHLNIHEFNRFDPTLPRVVFWHDDCVGWRTAEELSTDKSFFRDRKVILLLRDVRDVIVSYYFQRTRRPDNPYAGSLQDFLREAEGSTRTCLAYWNIWYANRSVPADFLITSYERLAADTVGELRRVLGFSGIAIGDAALASSAGYATFENMRAMEVADTWRTERLRPGDPDDPESYKTRRGLVGGFRNYLDERGVAYLEELVVQELHPDLRSAALAADGHAVPAARGSGYGTAGSQLTVRDMEDL